MAFVNFLEAVDRSYARGIVKLGKRLKITVTNSTPPGTRAMSLNAPNCGAKKMTSSSLNIHYHGTNTSPTCHQDEVIKTLINSGETFQYTISSLQGSKGAD